MTSRQISWRYQKTLNRIIRWCEAHGKTRFRGFEVDAPRGHLIALAYRGRIRKVDKDMGVVYELIEKFE